MTLKILLFVQLIIFSLSLKETLPIYKSMTELNPPLLQEACQFEIENEEKEEKTIYVKSCNDNFHCGNEINGISTCIPNFSLQKMDESCNYDAECEQGHCDSKTKKCTFDKDDVPKCFENEEICRCGKELVYSYNSNKCVEQENIDELKDFCKYTKSDENSEEVFIEANKPFYVCGEAGYANEKYPFLKLNSPYIKMTKVGTLPLGAKTFSEFACQSGSTTKSKDDDEFWICDEMKRIVDSGINEEGKAFVIYEYEIANLVTITEDDYYEYYSYRNILNGNIEVYSPQYHFAFNDYIREVNYWEKKCKSNSHDYYFSPFDCNIQEIFDSYYYLYHIYFKSNYTRESYLIMDALKKQEFGKRVLSIASTKFLTSKISILGLIIILLF